MVKEMMDPLYENKGIDTPYERNILTYRPDLSFTKEQLQNILHLDIQQAIERSRTFTISQNLMEYDELIQEVEEMLQTIENRVSPEKINQLKEYLKAKQYKEVMKFEKENSGYQQTGDYELYTTLYLMRESMKTRRDFLDDKFRTQFTQETEIEKIREDELASIANWEQLEAIVLKMYEEYAHHADEEDEDELGVSGPTSSRITLEAIGRLEEQKRKLELFHTTLADTSYIHRNRYFLFLDLVEHAKILVYQSNRLIEDGLRDLILSFRELPNLHAPKSHLILQFRKIREKHEALKGKILTIDDAKESLASEKQLFYQQLETKAIEPIKNWLHNQEEGYSKALDLFSGYMVNSMKEVRSAYDEINADMLNFYKSEADFYQQQIIYLKEKEEIRKFYRILEDLEDVERIRISWVDEYLKASGYQV